MNIMVCYDQTEQSQRAIQLACEQAEAFKGEVTLVTTMEKGTPDQQDQINAAKKNLEEAEHLIRSRGISCRNDLLIHGLDRGEDLVQFAADRKMNLIIIGIVKKSRVGKLFFGSTAQHVILNAPCPVLTVN